MALFNRDFTARGTVLDTVDVSDLKYSSLKEVVGRLTELLAQGYTGFDAEIREEYGSSSIELGVTKQRLENDEEYANRMKLIETSRQRRHEEYLRLKAEFEGQ
jgi:hypothetical protein